MIHTRFIQKHQSHAYLPVLLNYLNSLLLKAFISSNRGIFYAAMIAQLSIIVNYDKNDDDYISMATEP